MDDARAKALLDAERERVTGLLREQLGASRDARDAANEQDDVEDTAGPLVQEGVDDAVVAGLREHLERIERAEQRLRDGTYGRSVVSGRPIADARLEADPAAETTVDEAEQNGRPG